MASWSQARPRWHIRGLSRHYRQTSRVRFGIGTLLFACVVVLAVVSIAVPTASTQAVPKLRGTEAQQRCVDRWNQMKMHWSRTIAIAASHPRCAITLAYTYRPYGSSSCRPPARLLPGTPKLCLDRHLSFECVINRYGAYHCPTHASAARLRGWNAAVTQGGRRLVLDRPPPTNPKHRSRRGRGDTHTRTDSSSHGPGQVSCARG